MAQAQPPETVWPRVLLVEDNPSDALIVRAAIEDAARHPFPVDHVTHLAHARERLSRGDVGVVVLDLSLPDSVGLDTIAGLGPQGTGIPVVVVTGHDDDTIRHGAEALGVLDFVSKDDLDGPRLARLLETALARDLAAIIEGGNAGDMSATHYREIAARAHKAASAVEFGIDCLHKINDLIRGEEPSISPAGRPGVLVRRNVRRSDLLSELTEGAMRALGVATCEIDRLTGLSAELQRELLSRRRDPKRGRGSEA
jgi:DNA-binding NarL/FixJ family response regulator